MPYSCEHSPLFVNEPTVLKLAIKVGPRQPRMRRH
jgi:hypothetical protein